MSILNVAGSTVTDNILEDSGLDWDVELTAGIEAPTRSGGYASTTTKCATVRTDNNRILGIVGPDYKIVQNNELAYMAEKVAGPNLKVTSAGSLKGGGRVWMAIEAPSFSVGSVDDEIKPYLLLSNGHDGLFSLSGTPTSIRVWCENTLNMALAEGRRENMCISIRHKGDMNEKIAGLTTTLQEFYVRSDNMKKQANYLASSKLTQEGLHSFFRSIYNKHVDTIPTEVVDSKDQRKQNKWMSTLSKWYSIYDSESDKFGSNRWVAMNAVTNWIDHASSFRGVNKGENRFHANFFGESANKKQQILETSIKMV
jgi:phage/plasmid-like protein (TIGR03299 family)